MLSICIAEGWRDVGMGSELVAAAQVWAPRARPAQGGAGRLPGQRARHGGVRERGFVREGLRRMQYRSGHLPRRGPDGLVPAGRVGPMTSVTDVRARCFDAWADEYERYRPGYPVELFDADRRAAGSAGRSRGR